MNTNTFRWFGEFNFRHKCKANAVKASLFYRIGETMLKMLNNQITLIVLLHFLKISNSADFRGYYLKETISLCGNAKICDDDVRNDTDGKSCCGGNCLIFFLKFYIPVFNGIFVSSSSENVR